MSPHPRSRRQVQARPYGDFVMQVDWTVGQVIKAVDDAGIKDNTLLIYTSDNASFMYRESDKDKPHHLSDETEQRYSRVTTRQRSMAGTKPTLGKAGTGSDLCRWPKGSRRAAFARRRFAWSICSPLHPNWPRPRFRSRTKRLPTASVGLLFRASPGLQAGSRDQSFRFRYVRYPDGRVETRAWQWIGGREQPRGRRFTPPWQLFNLEEDPPKPPTWLPGNRASPTDGSRPFQILANDKSRK